MFLSCFAFEFPLDFPVLARFHCSLKLGLGCCRGLGLAKRKGSHCETRMVFFGEGRCRKSPDELLAFVAVGFLLPRTSHQFTSSLLLALWS